MSDTPDAAADAVLALQANIDDRVVEALIRVLSTRYDHSLEPLLDHLIVRLESRYAFGAALKRSLKNSL